MYFKAWDDGGDINDGSSPFWQFYKDPEGPTYIFVAESADPLELGRTETINITGVADFSGVLTIQLEFEGYNHTMTNLGGGTWRYNNWTPNTTGTYPYGIYLQDNVSNWNATFGAIQVVDTTPPTYIFVMESADPLELGNPETILISGITDLSGIQTVRITIEGTNQTMINLGGGTRGYIGWTLSVTGTYSYTIYIQDNAGNWNAVSGSIEVSTTTATPNQDWLIWLLALVAAGAAFCAIVLYVRLNNKIQKLSKPKPIPPQDLPKKADSQ